MIAIGYLGAQVTSTTGMRDPIYTVNDLWGINITVPTSTSERGDGRTTGLLSFNPLANLS